MNTSTDEQLATQLQSGDELALAALMERYEDKLIRYGKRFLGTLGEDVVSQAVQDTFISAYENISGFDAKQRFSPWIYRIAHNAFVDVLRQRVRQPLFDFDTFLMHPAPEDSFAVEKENQRTRVLLEKGLAELPAAQREVISLYYFDDLSYKEIADVLRVPVGTVGVRLARARTALKQHLPDAPELLL
jgi:RNA polymerase sigma-70 factor (ECF subfamily)